ncbi:MAG: rhomboid family intramembrane serine protease [Myxococcota bacterium]
MTWLIAAALLAALFLSFMVDPVTALQVFAVAILFSAAVVLVRSKLRKLSTPDVELYDDVMVLPAGQDRSERRTVQYESLRAAVTRGRAPNDELVLEAGGHTYVYPREIFQDEEAFDVFFLQLRNRLNRHPRGAQIVAEIRHRENLARRLFRTRPRVTHGLLATIGIMFIVQALFGAIPESGDAIETIRLGANIGERTLKGEWYRLFTANFLHAALLHIYLNGLALLSLGGAIERILGRWTYLTVFLVSGVGGALASAVFPPGPGASSVGVSTALFGLLGAFAVLHLRHRRSLPLGIRQSGRWWFFVIGVNVALPFILPVIDLSAHLGGFIVGAFATWLILRWRRNLAPATDRRLLRPALGILALYAVAFGHGVVNAATFDARDRAEVADALYGPKIAHELDRFDAAPSPTNQQRLAYVLYESLAARGVKTVGSVRANLSAAPDGSSIRLEGELEAPDGATVWLFAVRGRELMSLIRVRVGSDVQLPVSVHLDQSEFGGPTELEVALIDGRGCDCAPDRANATVWVTPED